MAEPIPVADWVRDGSGRWVPLYAGTHVHAALKEARLAPDANVEGLDPIRWNGAMATLAVRFVESVESDTRPGLLADDGC